MAYTPTVWENDETELDETNMNHIEQGIKDNDDKLQGLTSMGNVVVDSIRSKNIIPVEKQFSITTSQSVYVNIPVGTYTISGKITGDSNYYSLIIFNKNGSELTSCALNHSGNLTQQTITLTDTADEIILYSNSAWSTSNGQTSTFNELQLEKGSTATSYSPHQNLTGEEIYSTDEVRIGTWIGKPLYRKIYTTTSLINDGAEHFIDNIGLSNIDWITSLEGFVEHNNDQYFQFNWINYNFNQRTYWQYKKSTDQLIYATDISTTRVVFVFEYTKTTD